MFKLLILLYLCLFVKASLINLCINPTSMDAFDSSKYSGVWYVVSQLGADSLNCSRHSFQLMDNNSSSNASNYSMAMDTYKYLDLKNEVKTFTMVFKLNTSNTGDLTAVIPEPSWFWRLLGWTERVIKMKVIDTDYINYDVLYHCNEDNIFYSHDEVYISTRDTNANVTQWLTTNSTAAIKLSLTPRTIKSFRKIPQSNTTCGNITFA